MNSLREVRSIEQVSERGMLRRLKTVGLSLTPHELRELERPTNANISLDYLLRYAAALNIPASELLPPSEANGELSEANSRGLVIRILRHAKGALEEKGVRCRDHILAIISLIECRFPEFELLRKQPERPRRAMAELGVAFDRVSGHISIEIVPTKPLTDE